MHRATLGLLSCLMAASCTHTISLSSHPLHTRVEFPDGQVLTTPTDIRFKWPMNKPLELTVSAPGFRTLVVDLRKTEGRFFRQIDTAFSIGRRREVVFILVEEAPPTP